MHQERIYYINSRNRLSGTNSNFTYKIDIKDVEPDRIAVLQANIPKSYYLIQDDANSFTLDENGSSVEVTITAGNYSRSTLKTALQSQLNSLSPNGWTYAITFPTASTTVDDGKYTFTVSGNSSIQPSFIFSSSNNMFEIMGFDSGSTNSFVADSLKSSNVINLQKENSVFIHSDLCTNGTDNILQDVYANDISDFGNVIFQNTEVDGYSKKLTTSNNNIAHFYLTNEDGNAIDLNGQNWNMTVLVYKRDTRLFDFIKSYAKILSK